MTEHPFVLAPFYKGWDVYQRHLVNALVPLSPDQLAFHTTQALRSIVMIATHIVAVRARWLYYVLTEAGEQLIPIGKWDRSEQPARSATALVAGRETTWKV